MPKFRIMKRSYIFLCLSFLYFSSFSQEKIFSSDYVYIINNQKFGKIIDDFIEHEKQYDYFDSSCLFKIQVNKQITKIDSVITFTFISGSHPSEISDWTFWEEINDKYFILKYYEYYFRIFFRNGEEVLSDTNLLLKINEKFHIEVGLKEKEQYETIEIGVKDADGNVMGLDAYERRMETMWFIHYQNGKFYEISRVARNYGRIK